MTAVSAVSTPPPHVSKKQRRLALSISGVVGFFSFPGTRLLDGWA